MSKQRKNPRPEDNPRPDETTADPNEQVMPESSGRIGDSQNQGQDADSS